MPVSMSLTAIIDGTTCAISGGGNETQPAYSEYVAGKSIFTWSHTDNGCLYCPDTGNYLYVDEDGLLLCGRLGKTEFTFWVNNDGSVSIYPTQGATKYLSPYSRFKTIILSDDLFEWTQILHKG